MARVRMNVQFDVLVPDDVDPDSLTMEFISGSDYDGFVINGSDGPIDDAIVECHGVTTCELIEDEDAEEEEVDGD